MRLDIDPTGAALDDEEDRTTEVGPDSGVLAEVRAAKEAARSRTRDIRALFFRFCKGLKNGHGYPNLVDNDEPLVKREDFGDGPYWQVLRMDSEGNMIVSAEARGGMLNLADYMEADYATRRDNENVELLFGADADDEELLDIVRHMSQHGYYTVEGDPADNAQFYLPEESV